MIPCRAINTKNRPSEIPAKKWIELGEEYHITFATRCLPQNVLAFSLYERPLTEECYPCEYFMSTRFSIKPEHVQDVIDLFNALGEALPEGVMKELLQNSNLEPA